MHRAMLDFRVEAPVRDLAVLGDDLAAQKRHHRPAGDRHTLVGRVVGAVVHDRLADRLASVRVPQHDVGVEADADRALLRIEAIHLGVVGRSQRDEFVDRDAALDDALRIEDRQPRFDAGNAVWHPFERGSRLRVQLAFAALVEKRAVVGRERLEHAGADALPDRVP